MNLDLELESWRQEWKAETEPLPDFERRIRNQNRRLIGGAVAIACCLAIATIALLRHPSSGWAGFAAGVLISTVVGGGYALWVRRGTWEPASHTTRAYAELLHRRAIATLRKTVFLRLLLGAVLVVLVGYAGFALWNGRRLSPGVLLLTTALALEIFWMRALERRRRRAVEEAARLVELVLDAPGAQRERMGPQ